MNLRHKGILAVIAFLMATTLGVAVAAHGTIMPIFLDSGIDAPADEECLTFEETGGDIFEWQACGGAFYQTVQDEGVSLAQRATIDFAGAGVACVDSGGVKTLCTIAGGGGGTPGGSDTQVQFNDGGAFSGDAALTYNKTTDVLSVNIINSIGNSELTLETLPATGDGNNGPAMLLFPGDGSGSSTQNAGAGGRIEAKTGTGGEGSSGQDSGSGGEMLYATGSGGAQNDTGAGGDGGQIQFESGEGGPSVDGIGGTGGGIAFIGGVGGNSDTSTDGNGGDIAFRSGAAGGSGLDGIISLRGDTYFRDIDNAPRNIYQGTDEEVTTTTLTDSANLAVTLTKARKYKFKVVVFSLNDGATEGIKLSLAGTATATDIKAQVYIYDDTLNTLVAFARITSLGGAGIGAGLSAGAGFSIIEGTIEVANGGTFLLQFAQNATGASSGVHVEENSSMEVLAIN